MGSDKTWSLTFVRLTLGTIVFVHALAHSFGIWGGSVVDGLTEDVAGQLSDSPNLPAQVIAYALLVLGLLLLLGTHAKISSILVLAVIITHTLVRTRYRAFFVRDQGIEYLLAASALCIVVATHGPGKGCVKLPFGRKRKP